MKIFYLVGLALVLILLFSLVYFYKPQAKFKGIEGEQFVNPHLFFGTVDKAFTFVSKEENPDFIESDGYYVYGPVDGESGIIILHPISKDLPRHLGTFILLNDTKKNYTLQVKVGNVAGKIDIAQKTGCDDNVFEIYLSDIFSSGDTYPIDKFIVNSEDGWVYREYNLNEFRGKKLYLEILSKAGGPCGNWKGEWGAISYLNVREEI
ncbi:MAG: hypothetical protein QXJ14_03785 [Candidatus Aenigmatarchaeota archaeon]